MVDIILPKLDKMHKCLIYCWYDYDKAILIWTEGIQDSTPINIYSNASHHGEIWKIHITTQICIYCRNNSRSIDYMANIGHVEHQFSTSEVIDLIKIASIPWYYYLSFTKFKVTLRDRENAVGQVMFP